jgi:metal-dependent amidase/aminoacylase/carboxypeptidase family protein
MKPVIGLRADMDAITGSEDFSFYGVKAFCNLVFDHPNSK